MDSIRKILAVAACALAASSPAAAEGSGVPQEPRPVTSVYRLEAGRSSALSTYLSPIGYSGSYVGASGQWSKAFQHSPEHWIMDFEGDLHYRGMRNPARTSIMAALDGGFGWSLSYRRRFGCGLQLSAGAGAEIYGGALYMLRNGNNPVSAMAYAGVSLRAGATWHTRLGRLPVLIADRVSLPTAGAFFSPEYGETYYEIWLGNHSGLAHAGWWGNAFAVDNRLSVTLDPGRTALEIGYRYSYRSFSANELVTHTASHVFTIGVIPGGIGLKKKAKANYAIY